MGNKTIVIHDYFFITVGAALTGIGWSAFLIPAQIVGGGVGGISTLGFYMWGITPGFIYLGINVILIILAVRILGASFGIRTIYGIICVSAVLTILPDLITKPILDVFIIASSYIIFQSLETMVYGYVMMADENAFISVSKVMGVYGNGFDRIRI